MLSKNTSVHRYFMELAYNGKSYHGWQVQPNAITVQEVVNKAISTILGGDVNVVGAGRTDTGVHASHFVAHFDLNSRISDPENLVYKLNRFALEGIRFDSINEVDKELHARFSAIARTYHYVVAKRISPFMNDFSWNYNKELDLDKMNEASKVLCLYTDFTSFARLHTDTTTNDCNIMEAEWIDKGEYLVFRIKADRFLRNMVRALVGTMTDIGTGKISIKGFKNIIENKERSKAGQSAPPQGLFLTHVEYSEKDFRSQAQKPFVGLIR